MQHNAFLKMQPNKDRNIINIGSRKSLFKGNVKNDPNSYFLIASIRVLVQMPGLLFGFARGRWQNFHANATAKVKESPFLKLTSLNTNPPLLNMLQRRRGSVVGVLGLHAVAPGSKSRSNLCMVWICFQLSRIQLYHAL